ncbi:hypothetical protein CTAYLR_002205 [Chrysophaeum taylorii]|uniref:Uncharacterized protein n=1 Tax=Chrysophaeum taylorii TaxID=2483200 RepID=A0AAD7UN73_9STRA|nr:hypothetical protein CTAYLR_002205 [Chrysophaeum taylorii]
MLLLLRLISFVVVTLVAGFQSARVVRSTPRMTDATIPGRWRLSFNLPARNTNVVVTARFADDEGFEPPQGRVLFNLGEGEVDVGRWLLSEDPNDRKDGLWIWGLFAEPLYPFLLMTIPSDAIGLPEGGQLAVRVNHKARPDDDAQLLTRGIVSVRRRESISADLVGLSSATYDRDTDLGTVVCTPILARPIEEASRPKKVADGPAAGE